MTNADATTGPKTSRRERRKAERRRGFAPRRFQPWPALAAVCAPGLGHWMLGEHYRAAMIALGVGFLFFGGLLIGGLDAVDSSENPGWFIGQACVGPICWAINLLHQTAFHISTHPTHGVEAIGRAGEIGTLYAATAGMMNLIAVLDAAFWRPRPNRRATDA